MMEVMNWLLPLCLLSYQPCLCFVAPETSSETLYSTLKGIHEMLSSMDARLRVIEKETTDPGYSIERNLLGLHTRIGGIEERLKEQTKQLVEIKEHLDFPVKKLKIVETQVERLHNQIETMNTNVQTIATDILEVLIEHDEATSDFEIEALSKMTEMKMKHHSTGASFDSTNKNVSLSLDIKSTNGDYSSEEIKLSECHDKLVELEKCCSVVEDQQLTTNNNTSSSVSNNDASNAQTSQVITEALVFLLDSVGNLSIQINNMESNQNYLINDVHRRKMSSFIMKEVKNFDFLIKIPDQIEEVKNMIKFYFDIFMDGLGMQTDILKQIEVSSQGEASLKSVIISLKETAKDVGDLPIILKSLLSQLETGIKQTYKEKNCTNESQVLVTKDENDAIKLQDTIKNTMQKIPDSQENKATMLPNITEKTDYVTKQY